MDRIADLRAKRAESANAFASLVEKMGAEDYVEQNTDQESLDTFESEIAAYDAQIKRVEKANELKASFAKPVEAAKPAMAITVSSPGYRGQKLHAFRGKDGEENAFKSGMWLAAHYAKDGKVRANAAEWCGNNGMVVKYQAEGINTAGGFLVPTEFENAVIDLREDFGMFRKEARVLTMSSDSMTIPRRSTGVTAYYVGENTSITESQKGWDQVQLNAKKLACLTRMSTELAEDAAINVADDLAREMGYAFAVAEDAAGWNGDGTSTYGGIYGVAKQFAVNVSSWLGAVDLASGHDTIAEVDAADIAKVMAVLPAYAMRTAKFYMSMQMWSGAFQRLIAAGGGNTIDTLTGSVNRSYLGFPVVIDQSLPIAASDISDTAMWLFGDLSLACRMGTRRGITVRVSTDRYLEYDQIAIQATERFDIVAHDLGTTLVAGPIVAAMAE